MGRKIIFIGGVHGVGKTTLCTKICDSLNINHYSASDLIKKVSKLEFPSDKRINGIKKNQDSLITAVDMHIDPDIVCLLDGHFCLLNEYGKVTEVPITTFTDLSPLAIVVLTDKPGSIISRIKTRDDNEMNAEDISAFQERELEHSKRVSKLLDIPWLSANPIEDMSQINTFISDIVEVAKR